MVFLPLAHFHIPPFCVDHPMALSCLNSITSHHPNHKAKGIQQDNYAPGYSIWSVVSPILLWTAECLSWHTSEISVPFFLVFSFKYSSPFSVKLSLEFNDPSSVSSLYSQCLTNDVFVSVSPWQMVDE